MENKLLTTRDVANLLQLKENTVYRNVKSGKIPLKRVVLRNKTVRYKAEDVQKLIEKNYE